MNPVTARFWVWHNCGWVRLSLRWGQVIELHEGGPTDEGYIYTREKFTRDEIGVHSEYHVDARDCDGRFEQFEERFCPYDRLAAVSVDDGINRPDWHKVEAGQRDHAAEAAGY